MLKTANDIKALIDEKDSEIQAIEATAKEEKRELTADETKAIHAWYGTDEDNPGEFDKLQAELKTAERREAKKAEIAAAKLAPNLPTVTATGVNRPAIPASARRVNNANFEKVYQDKDEAAYQAYVSGQKIMAQLGNTASEQWLNSHGHADFRADMSEGTNSAGGFLVPDPIENVLITIAEENGVLRRFARPSTMTSDTFSVPLRSSGLTVYYPSEGAAITESDLTLAQAALTAKKFATLTSISSELSEDSVVDIANELAYNIGLAFALAEDTQGFTGTGSPITGLENALNANSKVTAPTGNISWATLDLKDFEDLAAKLPRFSGASPCWHIHSAGYFSAMVRLMNANGGTPGSEIASGYMPYFLGYPVVFTQVLPSAPATSETVCYFGDLSQSVYMGIRKGVTVAADMGGKYFEQDQIAIRGIERVAITVANQDSSSAGPVVALDTAAS